MNRIILLVPFLMIGYAGFGQGCSNSIIKFQPSGECEGRDIQLIAANTASGNAYQWDCPNEAYNSTTGPFLYIPSSCLLDAGTYTLTVTDSQGCTSISTSEVNVIPKPVVSISGQAFACLGVTTLLYANDMAGNFAPYTYNWDNGQTKQSIKIKHNGGTYPHPSCTITNNSGCSAVNQTAFLLGTNNPPFSDVTYNGPTEICSPKSLELSAPAGSMISYQWRKNGKNINGANGQTFKAAVSGNYKVIVSDMNGCADTSDVVAVTVNPRPSGIVFSDGPLSFCTGDSIHLTAAAGSGYLYQWRKNGIPVNGATAVSLTVKKSGNYRVEITTDHDCVRLTDAQVVSVAPCRESNEPERLSSTGISAFPNPSSESFTIDLQSADKSEVTIQVFDILGKEVLTLDGSSAGESIVFGDDLAPGIYSARIFQSGKASVIRLVKN
jgi:hypothetical protein